MRISLVVATRNRSARLAETLSQWTKLESPDGGWQLVVVDNGSTDDTRAVLEAHRNWLPLEIVSELKPGSGRARNAGWRAASGDIVAFTDDDCYPAPDFLKAVLRAFDDDASLGFVGGRVLLFDQEDRPITIQTSIRYKNFLPGEFMEAGLIHGANVSFRRSALEAISGYNPGFGVGTPFCGDDVDAQCRALTAGFCGRYDPRILVYHHHRRRTDQQVMALRRFYDVGRGAYYAHQIAYVPALRHTYLRYWYWQARRQQWRKTLVEIRGALYYLGRRSLGLS